MVSMTGAVVRVATGASGAEKPTAELERASILRTTKELTRTDAAPATRCDLKYSGPRAGERHIGCCNKCQA